MAKYRAVQTTFWDDVKVTEEMTPEDRYFMLYLLTNPKSKQCGCYEITVRQMSIDTGYNTTSITNLLKRFEEVLNIIEYSEDTREVLIKNWHKYNWTTSPKILKCVQAETKEIKNIGYKTYINTLLIGYGYGINDSSQEKEKEKEKEKENVDTPSLEDIENYCKTNAKKIDIKDFYDYYSASNWLDNNGLPINWKQKVISWHKRYNIKTVTEVRNEPYNPYK